MRRGIQRCFVPLLAGLCILGGALVAQATARIGKPAPDFKGTDSRGRKHELSKYRGKYVVLEWLNHGCPYVKKHYRSRNMQRLQQQWTGKGVVWLSVVSSSKGKQGYMSAKQTNAAVKQQGSHASAVLIDAHGQIGRAYGAKTTPHMFIIDPKGTLIYAGAIDDKPSADASDIAGATNYVSAALTAALAGKPVAVSATKAYGCSVKY